jgi:hypothetical protein
VQSNQSDYRMEAKAIIDLHLRLGWWCIAAFALLGLVLEGLHGFKSGDYLDVANTTRRHMLTLCHAHGTLLGLLNVAFAWSMGHIETDGERPRWASRCLVAATIGLPTGFGLGGLFAHAGDPGLGILLVPPAAICLILAAAMTAMAMRDRSTV